ncbi:hypothetical protein [Spongiactinospora sp. 9N601]|uniref:BP74-related protein n=1 Tax=Spongiactinospora sp. 9N601 TaxID=3375149 RepID=UPI003793EB9D
MSVRRIAGRAGAALAALVLAGTLAPPAGAEVKAYFEFDYPPHPGKWVIKLVEPAKIQHARDLLSGATDADPHVKGWIVKVRVPHNDKWSWHYDPHSITFIARGSRSCDAPPAEVERRLAEVGDTFLPGRIWCPRRSRILREVR